MNKNLLLLNINHLILRTLIQGLLPIYPVYIKELGANQSQIGLVMALSYVMILSGTWLTGKIMPNFIKPKQLIVIITIPIVLCMAGLGMVEHWYTLLPINMLLLFFTGLNFTTANVLTGYYSSNTKVGKSYANIATASLLGTVIGGFFIGFILHDFGYKIGFLIIASLILGSGLVGLLLKEVDIQIKTERINNRRLAKGWFLQLLLATFFGGMVMFAAKFALSLELKEFGYNVKQISNYTAMGTLITLLVPYIIGKTINDKNTFRYFIFTIFCLLGGVILMLLHINYLPIILIIIALASTFAYSSKIPASYLIYSKFNIIDMAKAQSLLGSANWISGIVGFLCTGILLNHTSFEFVCVLLIILSCVTIYFGFVAKKRAEWLSR